jgi:peptidoglycan/LPS O-acetylase OafA/YrhL
MMQHLALVLFWKWALGMILADIYYRDSFHRLRRLLAARACIPIALSGAFLGTILPSATMQLNYQRFVLPFFCFILVGALLFSGAARWRNKAGEHLGDISYSIYLWHPLALLVAFHSIKANPIPSLLFSLSLTFILAELSYQMIEAPFQRLGRSRISSRSNPEDSRNLPEDRLARPVPLIVLDQKPSPPAAGNDDP